MDCFFYDTILQTSIKMYSYFRVDKFMYLAYIVPDKPGYVIYFKYGDPIMPKPPRFEVQVSKHALTRVEFRTLASSALFIHCETIHGNEIRVKV